MNPFKKDEIVVLLGAGASVDAGIPHAKEMVHRIEALLDSEWSEYRELYHYIRSCVYYAEGIRGRFDARVNYNIERVVNTLDELIKKEEHPLYPFVGSWNLTLLEVAGSDFARLRAFRSRIVDQLRNNWLIPEYPERASYYEGIARFQEQYQYPLRVFSLNYDLCVEEHCDRDPGFLERGFEGHLWDWRLFELEDKNIYLYKLHGSTDWCRNADGRLTYKDRAHVSQDEAQIIFGTSYKLQYVDPFLFFAYELRKWTLSEARLIISIGYGFGDEHINGILGQALRDPAGGEKVLLSVAPLSGRETDVERARQIERALGVGSSGQSRVICWDFTSKQFMQHHLDIRHLAEELFPVQAELFPEISQNDAVP